MHLVVGLGRLDQRTDRGRRGVEHGDLVIVDHLPEAAGVRIRRHALEHDLRAAACERPVRDVRVARDPADVGRAPEHVVGFPVEGPLHRLRGPQQVAARAVLHALRLAGRARRVQDEQRMLGADPGRFAAVGLAVGQLVHPQVAIRMPVDLAAGAAIDDHALDRFAAAHRDRLVGDALERQRLAAARLLVGGDQRDRADVDEPLVQRFRGEAAEHDRVGRADARAGLHRDDAFDRHRNIDDDPIALADAALLQRIREARHAREEIRIGDAGDGAVVGLEDHRDAFAVAGFDVAVEAVVRRVQLAVVEPLVERRVALVEHGRERLVPREALARETRPEAFVILLGLGDERAIGRHAGNGRRLLERRGRRELTGFVKNRFDLGQASLPAFV
ncbi:hypothetical protein BCCR75722_04473 [Burkholderia sola]|nr:hypothetical protein BCCR75384_04478 [Burkholderia cenocepacia]CAG2328146.1 hypothetical protein BCCR75388_04479 [Burkholderia cenocepacia]CAG2365974.1 hypothetical protein BCCR75594_04480 [Burkholderia cenocepacia]CAG2449977.1 hypothetical protein BCCR75600_04475 [Burkholderia cenocepacia]CAG2486454.1 hypothetical protein BCCR75722_04473 [Burkholderia cenocepacia]